MSISIPAFHTMNTPSLPSHHCADHPHETPHEGATPQERVHPHVDVGDPNDDQELGKGAPGGRGTEGEGRSPQLIEGLARGRQDDISDCEERQGKLRL